MKFDQVSIMSVAHEVPPHRITSSVIDEQLAPNMKRLGLPTGMLEQLTGIVARRFWNEGAQPSEGATQAASHAIMKAGIKPDQIGLLINTSVCRDWIEPSTASIVHSNLGLSKDCISYDLGNACLGFINGMDVAAQMITGGCVDYALVVNGESSRQITTETLKRISLPSSGQSEFREEFAALTLGSGAAAMLLCRQDLAPQGHRYLNSISQAATEWNHLCHGSPDKMYTDTGLLLVEGLKLARRTWDRAGELYGWCAEGFDHFMLHQVSRVHTQQLCTTLGIDIERCYKIFPEWGNVGPAGVPLALSMAADAGRFKPGDRIALMGIGSGLNCTMSELVW